MERFLQFVNWLMPKELRDPTEDEDQWFRAQVLFSTCICAIVVQMFIVYIEIPKLGFTSPYAAIHYIIAFLLLLPLTMRLHGLSLQSVTTILLFGMFSSLSSFIYIEDSLNLSTFAWFPVIVMASYFLNSGALTYFFILFSIAVHGCMLYLWTEGIIDFHPSERDVMMPRLISDITGSMIMAATISFFSRESHRLIQRRLLESRMQIIRQKEQLAHSAKMVALGEMAGGIAHEINNPLMIIAGRSEQLTILSEKLPASEREQFVSISESIVSTTQRIARIISSMRIFARDTSGEPLTEVKLLAIVNDALALCGERFRHYEIHVITEVKDNISIDCRPIQISQIMVNLLSNSFFAVKNGPIRWIRISTEIQQESVMIIFEDSGPGVPKELHQKLFQPFFTTKDVGVGTGLGLSLSLGIAREHGGDLTYDFNSTVCRFILRLPLTQTSSGASS